MQPPSAPQQPRLQVVLLQTQEPPWQAVPAGHGGRVPQAQLPFRQALDWLVLQLTQAPASRPQVVRAEVVHTPELQHPLAQFAGVQPEHAPLLQVWVPGHVVQLAPPAPHCDWLWLPYGTQAPPAVQHPSGQLVASQTQAPRTQRWPEAQGGPPPHPHCPPWQVSVVTVGQVTHAPPSAPQAENAVPSRHWLPSQHPLGQLVPSQMHCPPRQRCPEPHAACPPQVQLPPVQVSVAPTHWVHVPPPIPQALAEPPP